MIVTRAICQAIYKDPKVVLRTASYFGQHSSRYFASSSSSDFKQIGVIGLGLMGHGIAQVTAEATSVNWNIVAYDAKQEFLDSGKDRIVKALEKRVSKGDYTQDQSDSIQSKIRYVTDLSELKDTDLIVEAVTENMDLKRDLYTSLGQICKPETIFASNTSSLSILEMAQFSGRPDKFVGIHFFNPVQRMKLVEVIRTKETDPVIFDTVSQWVKLINKVPVSCGDTPGFIVNRLLVPALMQAMLMAQRNDATIADIDTSMVLGAGHPMGPLHLADFIGLDTCLFIVQGWVDKYPNEPAFMVPDILKQKVEAGHLGRKTGQGFYYWTGDKRGDPVSA